MHTIGRGPRHGPELPVTLLASCHDRIRSHLAIARTLAAAGEGADPTAIALSAAAVERYFRVAFPLHVRDEEESIAPRLRGTSAALDEALDRLAAEHATHAPDLQTLLDVVQAIVVDPSTLSQYRAALETIALRLTIAIGRHLALEERTTFPALAALPHEVGEALVREMRARRE